MRYIIESKIYKIKYIIYKQQNITDIYNIKNINKKYLIKYLYIKYKV